MKQIVIISGKGGTGKTFLASSFASLAHNAVIADCDVDASDLHLMLAPDIREKTPFMCGVTAEINAEACIRCMRCVSTCRFNAITKNIHLDRFSCEGCGLCALVCPMKAITMTENTAGEWYVSKTRFGSFVHARLGIAEENSGKLVSLVRQKAKEIAEAEQAEWVIVDGSPGIGCPVIASLSGIDCAIIVTEPTVSGLHDADRVLSVAAHFSVPVAMVINKYDLNLDMSANIEQYCRDKHISVLGKIPFDSVVVRAITRGKSVNEIESGERVISRTIESIWKKLEQQFECSQI